jgi:Zn-dependent M32 family carboxypeptidase
LDEKVVSQIQLEIAQIDQLFESYADLLERLQKDAPDIVELAAVASVLHSFYNGVENIFLSIAKGIDHEVPKGTQWHRDLLKQMAEATSKREAVLTVDMAHQLADYLGFRHFFRHSYSFFLDWNELEKLVMPLTKIWEEIKEQLQQFIDNV